MGSKEIIFIMGHWGGGGVERIGSILTKAWSREGYSVILVTLVDDVPGTFRNSDGLETVRISSHARNRLIRVLARCSELNRLLRQHQDAVSIAFDYGPVRLLALAGLFTRGKKIFSERNDPRRQEPNSALNRAMRRAVYLIGNADSYVFQTRDAMLFYPRRVQKKGVLIPNPINPSLPERWMGERRKAIVAAGRLAPQKNFPLLVRAFAKFSPEHPDYVLEIYGNGANEINGGDEPLLRELIQTLHMQDKILLMGFSVQIYDKMRECAMYISSSNFEGISNSMLEALALGLPCICTDCPVGGARMAIQDGENGLLVPVGDEDALCRAMKRVIEDPTLARKLGDNAYKIREDYSLDKISHKWLEIMFDHKFNGV